MLGKHAGGQSRSPDRLDVLQEIAQVGPEALDESIVRQLEGPLHPFIQMTRKHHINNEPIVGLGRRGWHHEKGWQQIEHRL